MPITREDIALAVEMARRRGEEVFIVDQDIADALFRMNEFITVAEYGSSETIRTGEIGRIFGLPVIVTQQGGIVSRERKKIDVNKRLGDT